MTFVPYQDGIIFVLLRRVERRNSAQRRQTLLRRYQGAPMDHVSFMIAAESAARAMRAMHAMLRFAIYTVCARWDACSLARLSIRFHLVW